MGKRKVTLDHINLVVGELAASMKFYRRLGVEIPEPPSGSFHVECASDDMLEFALDTERFASFWNQGWAGRDDLKGRVVIGFRVETREDVDALYAEMTDAGYRGLATPYDAFWGARYAIIEDPNGAAVGLMSPSD